MDQKFDGKDEPVVCMKFSPDSKFIAIAFENSAVIFYDTKNFKESFKFKTKNPVFSMDFTTDSSIIMINTLTEDADDDPEADPIRTMDLEYYDAKNGQSLNKQLEKIKAKEMASFTCPAGFTT